MKKTVFKMKKKDLRYDYCWEDCEGKGDDLTKTKTDAIFLNKNEGWEMLDFIDDFMNDRNFKNVLTGQKIEEMARKRPGSIRKREKVTDWIVENWNEEPYSNFE